MADEERAKLHARVAVDFAHHAPPDDATIQRHREVRLACEDAAHALIDLVPPGRELSMALNDLEHAMENANAGVARGAARQAAIAEGLHRAAAAL